MADNTPIEWTDATWNPVRGCAIVSKGCTNCYAMRQAHRTAGAGGAYEGLTKRTKGGPVWTGAIRLVHELLDQPLRWRRPRRIFVNSMGDLFHEDVDEVFIGSVLGIAAACTQHTLQVLTKRPRRMLEVLRSETFLYAYESSLEMYTDTKVEWPAPNVWLGVSVEDQAAADERIPPLLGTPAAVRWLSCEPLLGPIDLTGIPCRVTNEALGTHHPTIDWVVVGGESGPGARPMHPDWARSLRDQCAVAGVPYFFKQWGAWRARQARDEQLEQLAGDRRENYSTAWPDGTVGYGDHRKNGGPGVPLFRIGKAAAGRQLDGRTHDEYPSAVHSSTQLSASFQNR